MKKDVFKVELDRFKHDNVRLSTEMILEEIPEYFYEMPASTSGRFHPAFSLGEGGLVRHVKVAMRILEEMYRDTAFGEYDEYTKDLMRMALLLHDGFKSGIEFCGHTRSDHPVLMSDYLLQNQDRLDLTKEDTAFVARLIRCHMGPWNKDREGNEIMPVPKTREELLVHLCDYIASRNFLNVAFENNEIVDSASRGATLELKQK